MKYKFIRLGCPKNDVDADLIKTFLSDYFTEEKTYKKSDLVLINSCVFIEPAIKQTLEKIKKAIKYKKKYGFKLVITGCLYGRKQVLPDKFSKYIDLICSLKNIKEILDLFELNSNQTLNSLYKNRYKIYKQIFKPYVYVKIAEGCNKFCSYCSIPYIKGRFKSRSIKGILDEIKSLVEQGFLEIILVAQDTGFYGKDLKNKTDLCSLLEQILKIKGNFRIRLMYLNPEEITDKLIKIISTNKRICNYFEMPIQHTNNYILKKMNRKFTNKQIYDLINKIRKINKNIIIRTTVIVGFPGETKEIFNQLLKDLKNLKFDYIGVFPYYKEKTTIAYKYNDNISDIEKQYRLNKILELNYNIIQTRYKKWKQENKKVNVIAEGILDEKHIIGYSEYQAPEIDGFVFCKVNENTDVCNFIESKIIDFNSFDIIALEHKS